MNIQEFFDSLGIAYMCYEHPFARPDELMQWLKLTPGSVTPFGLIHDTTHHIMVMVDNDLLVYELVGFHPNINTATLVLSSSDFQKFLTACGIQARYCTLENS